MIKAIIFDLDNTLVYVEPEKRRFFVREVLKKFNVKTTTAEIDRFWFMHNRARMVKKWGIGVKEFWTAAKPYLEKRLKYTHSYDDVDVLDRLQEKGIKLALFTGSLMPAIQRSMEIIGRNHFQAIVVADLFHGDVTSKPDPSGVELCLKKLGAKKDETICVGNSDEDTLTAKNAGIYSVIVDRKEHPLQIRPDRVIQSLHELEELI